MLTLTLEPSAKAFEKQLQAVSALIPIALADGGLRLSCKAGADGLSVSKKDGAALICYEKKCEFFRGILSLLEHCGQEEFSLSEKASFLFNGQMIDNSRNSVLNLKTAKEMILYSALIGMDNILLYNEETYELPEDPYFGYLRQGYTLAEIRELTDFAAEYGVTIIPCVQTLAHLGQTLQWRVHDDIRDIGDILLCDEEKTYTLIENMIKAWRSCVDTDIINIGMDEAHMLGLGKYLDKNGYTSRFDIMCRHLERVIGICKKYNFKPMMWSDMFFRLCFGDYYSEGEIDEKLLAMVPKDVMLVYWDYYSTDEPKYDRMFKSHLKFGNEIGFAGGAWKWSGFVPAMRHSHEVTKIALSSAKKNGIETVFTTAWGDDGAEGSIFSILPNLLLFTEISYSTDAIDEKVSSKLLALTGYTLEEFFTLCDPNITPLGNKIPHVNPSKYLFYQDVLMGIFDAHVRPDFAAFYAGCAKDLSALAKRDSRLSYLFTTLEKLCSCLELKCDMGVRLKTAYDKDDRQTLRTIAENEIPALLDRVEDFYRAFKDQWYRESRTGGFDVQDIRFGGLERRLKSAKELLEEYLAGKRDSLPELAEKRLSYDPNYMYIQNNDGVNVDCNAWRYIVTPNVLSHF